MKNDVPVVKLKLLEKASYRTDNEPGNGNYVIRLASGEIGKDDLPTNIETIWFAWIFIM